MQSLAAAARSLNNATSLGGISGLLSELGFRSPSVTLCREEASSIGLPAEGGRFTVTPGKDSRRALTFSVDDGSELRPEISRVANRLAARAPHLLWVITAYDSHRKEFAIAATEPRKSGARVVALISKLQPVVDSDTETILARR